jgi:hypothetical protein
MSEDRDEKLHCATACRKGGWAVMMAEVVKTFAEFLQKRLRAKTCESEDCLRYSFFAALLDHGVPQELVVLEYPHPAIARKK